MTAFTRLAEWLKAVQGWEAVFDHGAHQLGLRVPRADTRQRVACPIVGVCGGAWDSPLAGG